MSVKSIYETEYYVYFVPSKIVIMYSVWIMQANQNDEGTWWSPFSRLYDDPKGTYHSTFSDW